LAGFPGISQLSPDVLFQLIQIVIQDADFTAVQFLAEKRASVQQTILAHQRAHFIVQIVHGWNPPLFIFTGRFFSGGGQSKALIKESFDTGN
jgi:hypothetical protein